MRRRPANRSRAAGDEMLELVARLSRKAPPTGRLHRAWILGSLQARVAAGYGLSWARGLFSGQDAKKRLVVDQHLRAALQLFAGMGYLRGAVMKIGQTLATYPETVPDAWYELLEALQCEAPPMHFSLLREQLRRELGADPEVLFASFETEAFAAASLGQVHRARLVTGEEVAVKIQYPGIARTIRSDLANLRLLVAPLRFTREFENLIEVFDDIEATFAKETDYRLELRHAQHAREILGDMEGVVVPRVYPELSSERVLTMEYLPGVSLRVYLAGSPPQQDRDLQTARMMRLSARLFYQRLLYADPHPGNYVFLPDGRLGLLDFGCCRELEGEDWEIMLLGTRGLAEGGEAQREAIRRGSCLTVEEAQDEERFARTVAVVEWLWEPLRTDEEFDFGDPEYLRRGMQLSETLTRRGEIRHSPMVTWTNRLFFGLRAVALRLLGRANLKRINDEEVARAGIVFD
jgi:predicted unusual protein kinase regulating ubiquinone biosynthesis (AarF/ABC1/UbiB family)